MDSFEAYFMQGLTDGLEKQAAAKEEPAETPVQEIIKKAMAKKSKEEEKAVGGNSLLKALLDKGKK